MRVIIDTGALRKSETIEYLRSSKRNELIFTDYLGMECLKGSDAIYNFTRSLRDVLQFGDQIWILKPTTRIIRTKATPAGRQQRYFDIEHTKSFRRLAKSLASAKPLEDYAKNEMLRRGKIASDYFDKLLANHAALVEGIKMLREQLSPENQRLLKNGTLSDETLELVLAIARAVYATYRKQNPDITTDPSVRLCDEFVFRYSLASTLMMLWWVEHGGIENVPDHKLRNDNIDMMFVTYASYYDGLKSCDDKANRIFRLHREIIQALEA